MKKCIILFDGKEITCLVFDEITCFDDAFVVKKNSIEIARFPNTYGYYVVV